MPSSGPRSSTTASSRKSNHRHTRSIKKTPVHINVYDLLPPGRLSSVIWTFGCGLLHSGVVIDGKEYAFGGHDRANITGVYWTKPKTEPPGGTWRCELLHGFTYATEEEIEAVLKKTSEEFTGPSYNLLTRNCNHFTSTLVQALTGVPAPTYLNRAASIGVALPCVVPAAWIEPPECELDEEDNEEARLTRPQAQGRYSLDESTWGEGTDDEVDLLSDGDAKSKSRKKVVRDQNGVALPPAERAPVRG